MTINTAAWQEALAVIGVSDGTLSREEKRSLDERGYLLLPRAIDPAWLRQLQHAFEAGFQAEHGPGAHPRGTRHVAGLHLQGELFQGIYTHPKLLAAAVHVIRRPFRLSGIGGRDPLPGHGAQALHADWGPREAGEPYYHLNSLWLLDDFTEANGATRVVPGSQLRTGKLPRTLSDPASRHPEEQIIVAPAGSVLVFNAHLLHSGRRNDSQVTRRVLTCSFVAQDAPYYGAEAGSEHPLACAQWLSPSIRLALGILEGGESNG